jgi:hypothetical protein
VTDVLPPKPDEPVDSVPPFYVRPLPRWFLIGFFGTIILVVLLLIVTTKVDPQDAGKDMFDRLDWLLD